MNNLLMISGDRTLAAGKRGAFYNTLSELHRYFGRIDVICPHAGITRYNMSLFENVFVHPSPWPLVLQPFWIVREGGRIIRAHRPALMTVHEYAPFYNGIGARLLSRGTSIPYVLEIMHIPGVPRASGLRERLYRLLTRAFIARDARYARSVRVINKHQAPDFLTAAGIPRNKMLYAPAFYIDLDVFRQVQTPKLYDIVFVGRMAENKGIDIFLDVIARTGLVGICVGEGPMLSWARREAKRRGLKIHFPGFAKDSQAVAGYLNESRMLLMPSLNEGGPRVVLEAMACGIPVVATPVGIVPDVLPPECIEGWSSADIADKVMNILKDDSLYQRLSLSGMEVSRQFEKRASVKAYAEALMSLTT